MILLFTNGNRYWEAKLPANYVPDDSKIENFIKTKYDLKRWVLTNTIPDPSTLDNETAASAEDSVVCKAFLD